MRLRNIRRETIVSSFRVLVLKLRLGRRVEVGFDTLIGPNCRLVVLDKAKVRLRGATLSRSVTIDASRNAGLRSWPGTGYRTVTVRGLLLPGCPCRPVHPTVGG